MPADYADFRRQPSKCMHHYYEDGRRCRAQAMHNNYMCFAHRIDTIPPVYENEPFEIPANLTRDTIQLALGNLAALLATNRMDLKRAGLLAYILQIASTNLHKPTQPVPAPPAGTTESAPQTQTCHPEPQAKDLSSSQATEPEPAPQNLPCHPEPTAKDPSSCSEATKPEAQPTLTLRHRRQYQPRYAVAALYSQRTYNSYQ